LAWKVEFDLAAVKDLKKLPRSEQKKILKAVNHIAQLSNPRSTGKALKGPFGSLWRYRMGNYRILCKIETSILVILVIAIGHRKDIYKHT
jgi:mRNA interferase RelE/StbE